MKWHTHLTEGNAGVDLDDTVKPTEKDRHGPQEDVNGVANKMGDQLDELGKDHPCCESIERVGSLLGRPVLNALP